MSNGYSTGKSIVVLAIVAGCFAVLWPKVFYPMLNTSSKQPIISRPDTPHPHARPERPPHPNAETLHPALRERGRVMAHRMDTKPPNRPGPVPGMRPPLGAGGHMASPPSKGTGAMGIIMPLYTVGIVIFFVYTIMKVLFKKNAPDEGKGSQNLHVDPECRKYVFAEEYVDSATATHRDYLRQQQERENSKLRKRQMDISSEPKIDDYGYTPDARPAVNTQDKLEDEQMDQLRRRLEETEKAMERLMSQMGCVTDKLTAAKITEVLTQAQAQAKILKEVDQMHDAAKVNTKADDHLTGGHIVGSGVQTLSPEEAFM